MNTTFKRMKPPYNFVPNEVYQIKYFDGKKRVVVCSDQRFGSSYILVDPDGQLIKVSNRFSHYFRELNGSLDITNTEMDVTCVSKLIVK